LPGRHTQLREESSNIKVGDGDALRLPYMQVSDALDYYTKHATSEMHESRSHGNSRDAAISPAIRYMCE
jgi:hypothetical protein